MFAKLALRNVRRSAKDYLVYFVTMTVVVALMFAFDSLLFAKDIQEMVDEVGILTVMLGLATFFIVIIVAWLINYMLRFIMEKRSREFGIYLLLGMEKRQIAQLYMRENMLLGAAAFLAGLVFGMLVQQILMAVLYSMILMEFRISIRIDRQCIVMTALCYAGCYLLALLRCKRKLRKMNIHGLINAERQNEAVKESHEEIKRWLLPLSIVFLLFFGVWLFCWKKWDTIVIVAFLIGLILVIYLFYTGLSAWVICYVRREGRAIYTGQNLFLLRQFASKIKTMRFTMGTLTALFVVAFLGCSIAMMFNFYQDHMLAEKMPFDIQLHSGYVENDFAAELAVIEENVPVEEAYPYQIYTNGTDQMNVYLYTHQRAFGDKYRNEDGSPDMEAIANDHGNVYCTYDTYMGLTDYNHLREMIGYEAVSMAEHEYVIHMKDRVFRETGDFSDQLFIEGSSGQLVCAGYYTEPFSQDGQNGGDYVIVVSDAEIAKMRPYYAELAVDIAGGAPDLLKDEIDAVSETSRKSMALDFDHWRTPDIGGNTCAGSDMILVWGSDNLVRDNLVKEMKCMLLPLIFPLIYIGLVFLCVALTVLSVQQLSDSAKYRFRYNVLKQIGMGTEEVARLVWKQLVLFYLCPALFAVVISGVIAGYVGGNFNFYSGVNTPSWFYFGISFLLFFGVYSIYFAVTYVGFLRNVEG